MAAHESLHSDQFFHGTNAEIPGDTVLPSAVHGRENFDYNWLPDPELRRNSVFMTRGGGYFADRTKAESRAWGWAGAGGGGRRRVHVVEPQGETQLDKGADDSWMAPKAKITDTIWTPPVMHTNERMEGDTVVQGTLPHTNWNDYRSLHSTQDANWDAYSPTKRRRSREATEALEGPRFANRTYPSYNLRSRVSKDEQPLQHIGQQQFEGV